MAGIVLTQNGNYNLGIQGVIDNNNITILDNYDLSAPQNIDPDISKFGIFSASGLNSKGILIDNNTINLRTWHDNFGIFINQSNNIVAKSNYIRRFTPSSGSGIRVQANQGAFISCNHSIGMDSDVAQAQNDAYAIHNSSIYLRDNYSNLTETGYNINENCTGIDLYNNEMGTHSFNANTQNPSGALYLGLNAQIGTQTDRFNRFTGQTSVAVKHPFNILPGLFLVDPLFMSPIYYPVHVPFDAICNNDPFFVCEQNQFNPIEPSEPCGTSAGGSTIQGMAIANPGGAVSVAEALAKGELNYMVYNEESKFEVSKSVERGLKENSITLPDTGIYVAWKNSLFQSNAARLNRYSYSWHKEDLDEIYQQQAQSWKQAATTAFDSTIAWLNEIQEAEDFETSQWQQRYLILKNMQENADNQLEALKLIEEGKLGEKRDSAAYWNHEVSNIKDYETMEKTINEIYLNTLAMGEYSFSPAEMEQITTIAWQCPLKSAAAVYKARSMYALVHPFTRFDNYSICNAQGMQYRAAQQTEATKPAVSIQIYPNPNSGQLNISWSEISGNVNYTLINALGQIVKKWNSADVLQSLDLNKTGIGNGLYIIQAQSEDGKMHQQKFIYQR